MARPVPCREVRIRHGEKKRGALERGSLQFGTTSWNGTSRARAFMNRRLFAISLTIVSLGLWLAVCAFAGDNLVRNGDLTEGSGDIPSDWRTTSQSDLRTGSSFLWQHQPGSPGELRLINRKPNITDWSQTVELSSGWYFLTGEIKAAGSRDELATIGIHVLGHEFGSAPLETAAGHGQWSPTKLYIRIGAERRNVQIICQLEGRGDASFRHIKLVAAPGGTPPPGAPQADLGSIRQKPLEAFRGADPTAFSPPQGRPWSIVALLLALMGITLWGWIALAPRALQ